MVTEAPSARAARDDRDPQGHRGASWQIFLRGVGCNWLVCLAVWMAAGAEDIGGEDRSRSSSRSSRSSPWASTMSSRTCSSCRRRSSPTSPASPGATRCTTGRSPVSATSSARPCSSPVLTGTCTAAMRALVQRVSRGERQRGRRTGRGDRSRSARPARRHPRRRRGDRRSARRQGARAARLRRRRRPHERAARRPRGARRVPVHAVRRRTQGHPPELRRRRTSRAGRAAVRALPRAARRRGRRVRRAHGGRARQRRTGDACSWSYRVRAVPPEERFVVRFAAEPPQEMLPIRSLGRHAPAGVPGRLPAALRRRRRRARSASSSTTPTAPGRGAPTSPSPRARARASTSSASSPTRRRIRAPTTPHEREPSAFYALADFTDETAEANPDWKLDLCDEVIGGWRGEHGRVAAMTLVWGRALTGGGAIVTAELAGLAVDQCALVDARFTLIAPDNYKSDFLEIHLWDSRGTEIARESPLRRRRRGRGRGVGRPLDVHECAYRCALMNVRRSGRSGPARRPRRR